jgi:hypothetical protein
MEFLVHTVLLRICSPYDRNCQICFTLCICYVSDVWNCHCPDVFTLESRSIGFCGILDVAYIPSSSLRLQLSSSDKIQRNPKEVSWAVTDSDVPKALYPETEQRQNHGPVAKPGIHPQLALGRSRATGS